MVQNVLFFLVKNAAIRVGHAICFHQSGLSLLLYIEKSRAEDTKLMFFVNL